MSLKRFKQGRSAYSGSNMREKIETYVDFPIEGLDLAPYCCDTATNSKTGKNKNKGNNKASSSDIGDGTGGQQTEKESETAATATTTSDENGSSSRTDDSDGGDNDNNGNNDNDNGDADADANPDRTLYDLFAVCNHFGRMGFGHYTAFARDWMDMYSSTNNNNPATTTSTATASSASSSTSGGGGWYKYDDEDVTPVTEPEGQIRTPAAYILFYRRRPANPRAN